MTKRYESVTEALKAMKAGKISCKTFAICANMMFSTTDTAEDVFFHHRRDVFESWPKFSGQDMYPIPDPKGVLNARCIFDDYETEGKSMWDKRTAYGKLRYELLDHLITYFETRGL